MVPAKICKIAQAFASLSPPPPVFPLYRAGQAGRLLRCAAPLRVTWRAATIIPADPPFPSTPVRVATAAGLPITRGGAGDALGLAGSDGSGGDGAVGLLLVGLGSPGLGQLRLLRGAQLSDPAVLVRGLCWGGFCGLDGAARGIGPVCEVGEAVTGGRGRSSPPPIFFAPPGRKTRTRREVKNKQATTREPFIDSNDNP